jgi:tagatose-1,6-bisphosphate aldolase non-catalytic subunit AgaZ/GatZ
MRRLIIPMALALLVTGLLPDSSSARERRRPKHDPAPVQGGVPDAQDPVDWMTDVEAAFKLAAEEKRALFILITTDQMERQGQFCRFLANSVRKAVREAKVVPLKVLPPPALDLTGLKAEEIKLRQEVAAAAMKKYEELAKRYGATTVPSLVYAAPDGDKLLLQASPADDDIIAALARLPEMIKAHDEATAKEGKKPEAVAGKDPPPAKPPEKKEPPKGGVDDF